MKETQQEVFKQTCHTLKKLNRKYLLRHMTLQRNSTGSTLRDLSCFEETQQEVLIETHNNLEKLNRKSLLRLVTLYKIQQEVLIETPDS